MMNVFAVPKCAHTRWVETFCNCANSPRPEFRADCLEPETCSPGNPFVMPAWDTRCPFCCALDCGARSSVTVRKILTDDAWPRMHGAGRQGGLIHCLWRAHPSPRLTNPYAVRSYHQERKLTGAQAEICAPRAPPSSCE
eukprot:6192146-Pleurochrysis_carterae.AAC.3